MFRFVCVLKENIDKNILQESVNEALKFFPNFRSILKKGFFWHYLETTDFNPIIKEEKKIYVVQFIIKGKRNYYLE